MIPLGMRCTSEANRGDAMMRVLKISVSMMSIAAFLGACKSESPEAPASSSQGCSTGNPYPDHQVFAVVDDTRQGLPTCAARCGAERGGVNNAYYFDGLPTGSCAEEGVSCQMAAQERCDCPSVTGPLHAFVCTCTAGQWSCGITVQGGATCGSNRCAQEEGGSSSADGGGLDDGGLPP